MENLTASELAGRRREALAMAERCATVLRRRFGARRVIPFGSLMGDGPWHGASDLDLAVEGLSGDTLLAAEQHLEGLAPSWLAVELVPLEHVYPEVQARILGDPLMPESQYLALKARLEDELTGLDRVVRGIDAALSRAGAHPDEFATRALASYVDDFYTGCERLCERVAVTLDGGLPTGGGWHREMLDQMGKPGGEERPALWTDELRLQLDAYRRFRHRVRHLYGYELETDRVRVLAGDVGAVFARVREAVGDFGAWLEGST